MAIKTILMLKRRKGMSADEFRTAYETRHSRLALRLFGHLWLEYRRNYLGPASRFSEATGTPTNEEAAGVVSPYDVITEIVYRDLAALEESNRIAALPVNARLLAEDEESMFDREACLVSIADVIEEDLGVVAARRS